MAAFSCLDNSLLSLANYLHDEAKVHSYEYKVAFYTGIMPISLEENRRAASVIPLFFRMFARYDFRNSTHEIWVDHNSVVHDGFSRDGAADARRGFRTLQEAVPAKVAFYDRQTASSARLFY